MRFTRASVALPRHTSTDHVQALLYTSILWDRGDGWVGGECVGGVTSGRWEVECTAVRAVPVVRTMGAWLCTGV